ncbi:serine hydrolase domain-containing protein [Sphingomicrobium nitratireducens]|uniref:serine hydrolase domain-containing protein n=1 Tax=Sphingomicrobium nitratireducens TaxID=2964666 RepID=UPI002240BC8E|nr:serine hydrolase domain-containing protein [Sphingomicrobium nitratireducens]
MTTRLSVFTALLLATSALAATGPASASILVEEAEAAKVTDGGTRYAVPEGWSETVAGDIVTLAPPEADSTIRLVEVGEAANGKAAIAAAWMAASPDFERPVAVEREVPTSNGWDEAYVTAYTIPPAVGRGAQAVALRKGERWTVLLADLAIATASKRGAQIGEINAAIAPTAYEKESFAGKEARAIDTAFVTEFRDWLKASMDALQVPGVAYALIGKDGAILHEEGLGVRDLASGAPVDPDTLFMVGSNTKGMTTLMIASMVEDGLIDYDAKVIDYDPDFRLGSAETTDKVLVRHLICACTGLPRKDMEWVINTPADAGAGWTYDLLAGTEPTSGFGEVFQYNNVIAAAAGYVAGHVLYPDLDRGAAYDKAMDERVFGPLGMDSVTFKVDEAIASGNAALFHGLDGDGKAVTIEAGPNRSIYPVRPAGAAWADIGDFASYVANELTEGVRSDGTRVFAADAVTGRRVHSIPIGKDAWYGMGVMSANMNGVPATFHGGDVFGHHSQYIALPDAGVAMAILTNGTSGSTLYSAAMRKFVEMVYDAKELKADEAIEEAVKNSKEGLERFWSKLVPVDADRGDALLGTYEETALGRATLVKEGEDYWIRLPSFSSKVMLREHDDGTASVVLTDGMWRGVALLIGDADGQPTLTLDDSQHKYRYARVD